MSGGNWSLESARSLRAGSRLGQHDGSSPLCGRAVRSARGLQPGAYTPVEPPLVASEMFGQAGAMPSRTLGSWSHAWELLYSRRIFALTLQILSFSVCLGIVGGQRRIRRSHVGGPTLLLTNLAALGGTSRCGVDHVIAPDFFPCACNSKVFHLFCYKK